MELGPQVSPEEIKSREAELESHSWMDSDTVFLALFRTAVERASCGVHKLLHTGGVHIILTSIVLALADGLSCLWGSERLGRLTHRYLSPLSLSPVPNRPHVVFSLWT